MRLMSDKDINKTIRNVKTTLAVEGLIMDKRAIINGKKFLRGQITSEQAINEITSYITLKRSN